MGSYGIGAAFHLFNITTTGPESIVASLPGLCVKRRSASSTTNQRRWRKSKHASEAIKTLRSDGKMPKQSLERINLNVHHTSASFVVFHLCSKFLVHFPKQIADQDGKKRSSISDMRDPKSSKSIPSNHQSVRYVVRLVPRHVLPNVQEYTPRCQVDWWSTAVFLAPPPASTINQLPSDM